MTYTLKFILDVISEEMEKAQRDKWYTKHRVLTELRQKFCEIDNELTKKEIENATHDN